MSDELLGQFLIEGREQCREAAQALEQLRAAADDRPALEACFRAVHTLKGSTGLFDLAPLGRMLHAAEDRLDAARQTGFLPAGDLTSLVRIIDLTEAWLDHLAGHGALPADAQAQAEAARIAIGAAPSAQTAAAGSTTSIRYVPREDAYFTGDDPLAIIAGVPELTGLKLGLRETPSTDLYDPFRCRLIIEATSAAPVVEIRKALALVADQVTLEAVAPQETVTAAPLERAETAGPQTMRLAVERLDEMARLAEELAAARNGLVDMARGVARLSGGLALANQLTGRLARVERLSNEIHDAVAQARLVPLSGLFDRLPRLVRSLSETLGKPASLTVLGGALQVDRAVVEGLADPMLHVLRNAMDHGLEAPDRRAAMGKPAAGLITIHARRHGAEVALNIQDDGGGVDLEAVRARAVERELVDAVAAAALGEDALLALLFHPGFTTARETTSVSGRGVGMDAVRTAAGRLGGRVQIRSTRDEGTIVTFLMPASIMLTPLAVVSCAGARYALPLTALTRTLSLQITDDADSVTLGGRNLRLTRLSDRLGAARSVRTGAANILLLEGGSALVVDTVHGRLDAAVRPLTGLLAGAPGFAGSATAPDGSAILVLDAEAFGA